MVVNRVSDLFFTIGILAVFFTFQTVDFSTVFALAPYFSEKATISFAGYSIPPLTLITFLLFLGAMGKSAQIGLHTWLPDAMEGWLVVGPSNQKILLYAGTASLDTLVSCVPLVAQTEKFKVNEANPQETDATLSGSSETLRRTASPFNFKSFLGVVSARYGVVSSDLEWLIGFTEGRGSFIVNNSDCISFQITQSSRDVQVLYRVRKILGFGIVSEQDALDSTWRFRVCNRENLQKIIHFFNGNLVLEKNCKRFVSFVAAFNACYGADNRVVTRPLCPTLADAWLSGFTDAEGCFIVSVVDQPARARKRYQVFARYVLAQKDAEKELRALTLLVGGRLSYQKSYKGYNLSVQLTHLKVVLRYFRLFPLKTIKRVSLIKFLSIYRPLLKSVAEKRLLTVDELSLIKKRVGEINKIAEGFAEDKVRSTK